MQLAKWIKKASTKELRVLAKECGVASNYLYYVALNGCSARLAKKIEAVTMKLTPRYVVTRHELRPDIWEKENKSTS